MRTPNSSSPSNPRSGATGSLLPVRPRLAHRNHFSSEPHPPPIHHSQGEHPCPTRPHSRILPLAEPAAIVEPAPMSPPSEPSSTPPPASQPDQLTALKRDLDQTHQTLAALGRELRHHPRPLRRRHPRSRHRCRHARAETSPPSPNAEHPAALVRDLLSRKPQLFRPPFCAARRARTNPAQIRDHAAPRPSPTMSPKRAQAAPDSPAGDRAAARTACRRLLTPAHPSSPTCASAAPAKSMTRACRPCVFPLSVLSPHPHP